jgi:short-subunit dehydrogenase
MKRLENRVAVVTGAASGIGQALALCLAGHKCDLALVDVNEEGLRKTKQKIHPHERKVSIHIVDVSRKEKMVHLPDEVLSQHGKVNILINNAGVSLAGRFEDVRLEDFEWIFGVNFWGMIYGCKFFLPHLRKTDEAHIVNVASDFGLFGLPTKTGYCSTKFAMRGFSEALRAELYGSNVGLTCVYPCAVNTAIVKTGRAVDEEKKNLEAQFLESHSLPAEKVAEKIVRGIKRNSARVLIGFDTRMIDLTTRLAPSLTNALIARTQKRIPFL